MFIILAHLNYANLLHNYSEGEEDNAAAGEHYKAAMRLDPNDSAAFKAYAEYLKVIFTYLSLTIIIFVLYLFFLCLRKRIRTPRARTCPSSRARSTHSPTNLTLKVIFHFLKESFFILNFILIGKSSFRLASFEKNPLRKSGTAQSPKQSISIFATPPQMSPVEPKRLSVGEQPALIDSIAIPADNIAAMNAKPSTYSISSSEGDTINFIRGPTSSDSLVGNKTQSNDSIGGLRAMRPTSNLFSLVKK